MSEDGRKRTRAWLETPAGLEALDAIGKMLRGVEQERGANDDEGDAVAAAQETVLSSQSEFLTAIGADKVLVRRSVGFALAKSKASDAEVERVLSGIEADPDATSEPQRRLVRRMTMRAVVDLGCLPRRITAFAGWQLFLGVNGRKAAPGEIWRPIPAAGVDMDTGPDTTFVSNLVQKIGYTSGYENDRAAPRLPRPLLKRAMREWEKMRKRSRTRLPAVKLDTIRRWCSATGPIRFGEQFDLAYRQGILARERRTGDPRWLLSR